MRRQRVPPLLRMACEAAFPRVFRRWVWGRTPCWFSSLRDPWDGTGSHADALTIGFLDDGEPQRRHAVRRYGALWIRDTDHFGQQQWPWSSSVALPEHEGRTWWRASSDAWKALLATAILRGGKVDFLD